ncbi:MAG: hypothetical protein CfP315_0240 [Candidatus Improbicoccus pseudotrichonymphae]|uniref:Copper amine oxidase-like N-terminal domain-containing protein n=1 Tax=Candidatus Improbicoccus pseudotrichonymphae TaxID=3033792 RepID=A0AA48KYY0_9FIRM|nr:MAG: hypothetical protein CfP315_0240 [Candidatus Improbicoccus pseudotrichonymphae]
MIRIKKIIILLFYFVFSISFMSCCLSNGPDTNKKDFGFYDLLSKDARDLFDSLPEKSLEDFYKYFSLDYGYLINLDLDKTILSCVSDIIFRQFLNNEGLIKNESSAEENKNSIEILFENLRNREKTKYSDDFYNKSTEETEKFAAWGRKTQGCPVGNVVLLNEISLKDPSISYDGTVYVSIYDGLNISKKKCEIEYMSNNGVIILKAENDTIEFELGKKEVYLNDKITILDSPLLFFNNMVYIPIHSFMLLIKGHSVALTQIPGVIIF